MRFYFQKKNSMRVRNLISFGIFSIRLRSMCGTCGAAREAAASKSPLFSRGGEGTIPWPKWWSSPVSCPAPTACALRPADGYWSRTSDQEIRSDLTCLRFSTPGYGWGTTILTRHCGFRFVPITEYLLLVQYSSRVLDKKES